MAAGSEIANGAAPSLRQRLIRGAVFLTGRSVAFAAIGALTTFIVAREIGLADFGTFVAFLAIVRFVSQVGLLGIDVYLIRREDKPDPAVLDAAFTLLALTSVIIFGLGWALSPLLGLLYPGEVATGAFLLLLLAVPLANLGWPPIAFLERELDYRSVATVEISSKLVFALVAITLALAGAGVWAPVTGYLAWQLCRMLLAFAAARRWPRLRWSTELTRSMVHYGFGYSASIWVWQLRNLVNPILVGGTIGLEAVGIIGLANTIVQTLAFARQAAWRLSLSGMARVREDKNRSARLLNEAMLLQVLILGPVLAGFAVVGPFVFPLFYGPEWSGVMLIYPFIALGALANAVFNMHSSQLYVHGENLRVTLFHVLHVALLAAATPFLTQMFGLVGFGYAELVAFSSYWLIDRFIRRHVVPYYGEVLPWLVAFTLLLGVPLLHLSATPLLALPLTVLLVLPSSRRRFRSYLRQLREL